MTGNAIREALAPEGVLPLRVNELTPSVIICAEGSRISIQWREQRPDQPDHDEYGRAEAMAAFLVEAANRHGTAYDAIGSRVEAPCAVVEFAQWVIREGCWERGDLEGGDIQDEAVRLGLLDKRPFDPTTDVDMHGACEAGDDWFMFSDLLSTHTAAGAGPVGEAVAWRDMASAPKDGTRVLLFFPTYKEGPVDVYRFNDLGGDDFPWEAADGWGAAVGDEEGPTHWAPLPAGPLSARTVEEPGEVERLRAALVKINDIRDSIIGFQNVGWSEHIYPLVAALHEAGFEGEGYEEASRKAQTLLDQRAAAEIALAETRDRLEKAEEALRAAIRGDLDWPRTIRAALTGDAQEGGK